MPVFKKKIGGGKPYARKTEYEYEGVHYEADLKSGDIVKIMTEPTEELGQYGQAWEIILQTRNGEKKFALNQKTINIFVDEFGEDSKNWVGKNVEVITKKDVIAGKKVIVVYLVSGGWELDEYGELVKVGEIEQSDINLDDIPY